MDLNKQLIIAAEEGDEAIVIEMLANGASPDAMGPNSGALHCAAFNGHINIIKLLLEKGANPNVADNQSFYPLHLAASKNEIEICELLLSFNADVNAVTSSQGTVLHVAAAINFYDILKLPQIKAVNLEAKDIEGKTALHVAASLGNFFMVRELVELGADVNSIDSFGDSALINAINYADTVKVVEWQSIGENSGVKVKYQIVNGTFRYIKPYNGNPNELGTVLSRDEQYEISEYPWGPDGHLKYLECIAVAEFLIENGADVHLFGQNQCTPMISACSLADSDLISLLFEKGASFDTRNNTGATPLHYIARSKRLDALEMYFDLSDNKNPNLLDDKNWTPGHYLADLGGHPEMAKLLIYHGLDLEIGGNAAFGLKEGIKAFEVAEHWKDPEMASLLSTKAK
jgi:ankyrin repeat protein